MYAYNIIIQNKNIQNIHDKQYEQWVHDSYTYLYFLQSTGQIVQDKNQVILQGDTIKMPVFTFEKEAFLDAYHDKHGLEHKKEIEENIGTKIEYELLGRDADNPNYFIPKNPSFLLLRFGWESAIMCGDTHKPIPLYHLFDPQKEEKIFDDIRYWYREYGRIFELWIGSGAYEDFAKKELEDHLSSINQEGIRLSQRVEKLTAKPCYYMLFNDRSWSQTKDRSRKCPICGKKWLLEGKTHDDFIAFKCDRCRLVSELSPNAE